MPFKIFVFCQSNFTFIDYPNNTPLQKKLKCHLVIYLDFSVTVYAEAPAKTAKRTDADTRLQWQLATSQTENSPSLIYGFYLLPKLLI